ncbi:Stp1/IreP family PP2C-type Ser/Thr phosphatase [Ampullimonas aquatilis]|uniref:Stp1/IreP family PP2C-type Ser/Thr phosphatase n=1 Tax=Ampullimonas aquatilis TaxID=1341549 RepID=UPI003C78641F
MPHKLKLEIASVTDIGLVRRGNEDMIGHHEASGLFVLADGMGGYNAGEIASSMAVEGLLEALPPELDKHDFQSSSDSLHEILTKGIESVNLSIFKAAQSETKYAGMGTTLVVGTFQHGYITIAHIGDSRAYRLRDFRLTQLTHDHSLLQEQIDIGLLSEDQARQSPHRNLVTRALGVEANVLPEIHDHTVRNGDLFLFCSDGLTDMINDENIAQLLLDGQQPGVIPPPSESAPSVQTMVNRLLQAALHAGGDDNTSIILVRVIETPPSLVRTTPNLDARSIFARMLSRLK